jgi:hypothetical protein
MRVLRSRLAPTLARRASYRDNVLSHAQIQAVNILAVRRDLEDDLPADDHEPVASR